MTRLRKGSVRGEGCPPWRDTGPMVAMEGGPAFGSDVPMNRHEALAWRGETVARNVRLLVKKLPRSIANEEDIRQLVRASGSVGANYIEANEALGRKDFYMHIKISRKESKESRYWLRLVDCGDDESRDRERTVFAREAAELMRIFGAVYRGQNDAR